MSRRPLPLFQTISLLITVLALALVWTRPTYAQDGSTQNYVSLDGSITFNFPENWIADEIFDGFMRIGSSQAVLDADNAAEDVPPLPSGEALLVVLTPGIIEDILEIDATMSPFDMVAEFTNPFETINEYQANGRTIAYAAADLERDEGLTFGIDIGGGRTSIMVASHAVGEHDLHFDTFLAIAESVHDPAFPPVTDDDDGVVSSSTFTTTDAGLSMTTPDGWAAGQVADTVLISFADGGVRMLVLPPNRVALELDTASNADDVAEGFTYILDNRQGASVEASRDEDLNIGSAVRVDSTYQDRDELLLAVEVEQGQFAVIIASMPEGTRATYEPQIFDIIETFSTSGEVSGLPTDTIELAQAYVDGSSDFEFMVPDGWAWHAFNENTDVDDIGIMIFTESEATYQAIFVENETELASDALMMLVFNPDIMYLTFSRDLGLNATAEDVFAAFIDISGTDYDQLGDTVTYQGNRNSVMYAAFESNGLFGVYGIVDLGSNEYVGFHILAESRDYSAYMPTILAIADTMVYNR